MAFLVIRSSSSRGIMTVMVVLVVVGVGLHSGTGPGTEIGMVKGLLVVGMETDS